MLRQPALTVAFAQSRSRPSGNQPQEDGCPPIGEPCPLVPGCLNGIGGRKPVLSGLFSRSLAGTRARWRRTRSHCSTRVYLWVNRRLQQVTLRQVAVEFPYTSGVAKGHDAHLIVGVWQAQYPPNLHATGPKTALIASYTTPGGRLDEAQLTLL